MLFVLSCVLFWQFRTLGLLSEEHMSAEGWKVKSSWEVDPMIILVVCVPAPVLRHPH